MATNNQHSTRPYDIVVFGASGFTGQLTVAYLAEHAPADAKIALAGRNLTKLAAVREQLAMQHPPLVKTINSYKLIQAEVDCHESIQTLAQSTRVVITTVGPYIKYGEPLLKACAEHGTDYVDLTGEPEFVDRMRAQYDVQARNNGARIVNSCGFDSIPHDLGVFYTIQELTQLHGDLIDQNVAINAYVSAGGQFSGGTWHSAVTAFARFRQHEAFKKANYQQLKTPIGNRTVKAGPNKIYRADGLWAVPFPTIDPQVVRRSAKLYPSYGKQFIYGHNALTKRLVKAIGGIGFVGGVFMLAQLKPTRKFLLNRIAPGDGPSEKQIEKGWFKVKFKSVVNGQDSIDTEVTGGDPGYGETSKMLAESALCLAFDREQLPANLGVTTPAGAMGAALLQRLQAAGIQFSVKT